MRVQFNPAAAMGLANQNALNRDMSKTLERLSTGLRINRASDDAAGLSVSEQLRTQVRGDAQAARNVNDAIGLVQIAEGAMNEIGNMLQRQRELAIQSANDTLTSVERTYLEQESAALSEEIDRINEATQYNTIQVLAGAVDDALAQEIWDGLQAFWLEEGLQRVVDAFGLPAPGPGSPDIDVVLEAGGTYAAYVVSRGPGNDMELHINTDSYSFQGGYNAATNPDGGPSTVGAVHADRVIAHEMAHALMAQNISYSGQINTGVRTENTWFLEGTAEYVHGADERLKGYIGSAPTQNDADTFIQNNDLRTWAGTGEQYASAYAAVNYLESQLGVTMQQFMDELEISGAGKTLDQAIADNSGYTDAANFLDDYQSFAGGAFFVANTLGPQLDAGIEVDTGALNVPGARNSETVIPNNINPNPNPTNYNFVFEENASPLTMQIGANNRSDIDTLTLNTLSANTATLGIREIDISTQRGAEIAIGSLSDAVTTLSSRRAALGAIQNRLDHTLNNLAVSEMNQQDAESRIRDADFSHETTVFTKQQILSQTTMSMIAQANANTDMVMALLNPI